MQRKRPMKTPQMRLTAFRVSNFRSVEDSGWIETSEISTLIGTNESGKTNLLVPLWKLNPAKEGEIKLITDAPRKLYNSIRLEKDKPIFIRARFEVEKVLAERLAEMAGVAVTEVSVVEISRDLGGKKRVLFPNARQAQTYPRSDLQALLQQASSELEGMKPADASDGERKLNVMSAIQKCLAASLRMSPDLIVTDLSSTKLLVEGGLAGDPPRESVVGARAIQLVQELDLRGQKLGKPGANDCDAAKKLVLENLPSFVYYTTYGNLDSEIYLPHVIENLKRTDLTGKEEAKARTLRVLFDFVKLKPDEILELGRDWQDAKGKPNDSQIQEMNEKKKERSVLLQSASVELTSRFRDFWKQGQYRLRFEADGNHFRIWVSDDQRTEEIELEGRSTGLQWFLSFYLIFLVESTSAHGGAILLLDEPGLSLHPLAQKDLAGFFKSLSNSNQLLYTTHSPFLVESNHLDRVKAVYVDANGHTAVSTDLRTGAVASRTRSIFPVHAALGLSVSDTLLHGCNSVIVEGQSDQVYLTGIRHILNASGDLMRGQDLVFVPSSGAKGIKTVAAILGGRDEILPKVLVDSDEAGRTLAKALRESDYSDVQDRIINSSEFTSISDSETEDLLPREIMIQMIDKLLGCSFDDPFKASESMSIVPQIKSFASTRGKTLVEGWKVDLAKMVKSQLITIDPSDSRIKEQLSTWRRLFERISAIAEQASTQEPTPSSKK